MEMPLEDYQRASELFNELLDVPADQLDSALSAACADNRELRSEVLRLIKSYRRSGSFLEMGAISDGAMMLRASGAADTKPPQNHRPLPHNFKVGPGRHGRSMARS